MKNLILFLMPWFLTFEAASQSDSLYTSAMDQYEQANYIEAFNTFNVCIESDSTFLKCYEKGGVSAYRSGLISDARKIFIELEKRDTNNMVAITQLATIYELDKNTPKAIKYYTKLTEKLPKNSLYFRKLAQQYNSAGLTIDAFKLFNQAYKLNSRDVFSIKGLAEIFIRNEQYIEADSIINIALEQDSTNISMHQLIAKSKYKQKDYDMTIDHLMRINRKVDLSPYFNKMLGYSFIQIDSFETAIYYLEKSLTDEGSKEYAHYYLAIAYENLDNDEYAEHHYHKALEEGVSTNVSNYHRSLAKIYNEDNKLKEAIPHYKDAYKYSEDAVLLFYLAMASDKYYADPSIAINYYKKYISSGHDNQEYLNYSKQRRLHLKETAHQKK